MNPRTRPLAPVLLLVLIAAILPDAAQAIFFKIPDESLFLEMIQWNDSVTVAGRRYAVPEQWRGLRVGLPDTAPPADLAPVPPELCAPGRSPRLRAEALAALIAMAEAAAEAGLSLRVQSGYRSADEQRGLFETRMDQGREFEEIAWGVAPPGYSEHMLGTVVDLSLDGQYAESPIYAWLARHAESFGFFESYPEDPSGRFPWEPWHWRYWGVQTPAAEPAARDSGERN